MKTKLVTTWLLSATLLGPIVAVAAADQDADRSHPKEFVKDSVITSKVKAKLAAEHFSTLGKIHVDTDRDGVVWLSGHAKSEEAIEKAGQIARDTEGVRSVQNHIHVKKDR
jgi:hyperosmotically inducible periplasmic protein